MARKISDEEAQALGIVTSHDWMDNGERRFRLLSSDGSSYCRTAASDQGAWQNSHYHKSLSEFYVVQAGWIVYAEYRTDGSSNLHLLTQGGCVTVNPFIHHNIFMSGHSVIHTIKYGAGSSSDWFASPELDALTRHLTEQELLQLVAENVAKKSR